MNIKTYLGKFLKDEKKHFWIFLFILTILSVFSIQRYLFNENITPGHDANFHYNRFYVLYEYLSNGIFPNYIDFDNLNNYGYATKLFYPDFIFIPFAYLGQHIGIFNAYQFMLFIFTFLCGIFTYKATYRITNNKLTGYISAILFTFSLYRIQDIFERSSIAESITFTFLPIVVWGLYELIKGNYKKWYILSIGCSLFVLTHVLSTILLSSIIFIIIIIYSKPLIKEPKRLLYLFISFITIILLSSYFILPLLEQFNHDTFNINLLENDDFKRVSVQNIISGLFILAPNKILYYKFFPLIGITLILPLFVRFFIIKRNKEIKIVDSFLISCGILLVICSDILPIKLYPSIFFAKVQFLYRYFEFISFGLAIISAYYLTQILRKNLRSMIFLCTITFLIIMMIMIHSTSFRYSIIDNEIIKNEIFSKNKPICNKDNNYNLGYGESLEYLPVPLTTKSIEDRGSIVLKINNETSISNFKRAQNKTTFDIKLSNKDIIELPVTYYKGYTVKLNNKDIELSKSKNGLIEIPINESGKVIVEFTGTFLQKNSIYITLISFTLLLVYIIIHNRKYRRCYKDSPNTDI